MYYHGMTIIYRKRDTTKVYVENKYQLIIFFNLYYLLSILSEITVIDISKKKME